MQNVQITMYTIIIIIITTTIMSIIINSLVQYIIADRINETVGNWQTSMNGCIK